MADMKKVYNDLIIINLYHAMMPELGTGRLPIFCRLVNPILTRAPFYSPSGVTAANYKKVLYQFSPSERILTHCGMDKAHTLRSLLNVLYF